MAIHHVPQASAGGQWHLDVVRGGEVIATMAPGTDGGIQFDELAGRDYTLRGYRKDDAGSIVAPVIELSPIDGGAAHVAVLLLFVKK